MVQDNVLYIYIKTIKWPATGKDVLEIIGKGILIFVIIKNIEYYLF